MALDKDVLGPLIRSRVDAAVSAATGHTPASNALRDAIFTAMADAIITHIRSAAVVSVAGVGGVTTGTGTSGTGTGTIL